MKNILLKLNNKTPIGVYSVCTANEAVIRASLEYAKMHDSIMIVEATANQVNQFGGYTGMTPKDYRTFVYKIADQVGLDKSSIILGGDHLGPLTWTHLPEAQAMENARKLVYDYAYEGYTKIHLDTSMKVADDDTNSMLSNEVIARRSAMLAQAAHQGYTDRLKDHPDSIYPVFIIGSEVPIPGGAQEAEETLEVTKPEDFIETYKTFKKTYQEYDIMQVFENVVAIVVQPGVEFGDAELFHYNRDNAKHLTQSLKDNFKKLNFEGHSTDYQKPSGLKQMVEDGITILKVGPALTFAYREALFALSHIESILCKDPANFPQVLEEVMLENPSNWNKHYHGTPEELAIKRKFSYSDRARYYLPQPSVDASIKKLIQNLSAIEIPETLLSQYLPIQYRLVKEGIIENKPESLISAYIQMYLDDYEFATLQSML